MLEENNKPDTDQTKYIRAITEEAITQGQARRVFTFAFSLNVFQNTDISKPSTHSWLSRHGRGVQTSEGDIPQ